MKITVKNKIMSYGLIIALSVLSYSTKNHVDSLNTKIYLLNKSTLKLNEKLDDVSKVINRLYKINEVFYKTQKILDPQLLRGIIIVESGGNPDAYNEKTGATGLMQLTKIVFQGVCGLTKEEAFEPDKNIACGSMFFAHLLKKFNGNLEKALTFYNSGYRNIDNGYALKVMKEMKGKNNGIS